MAGHSWAQTMMDGGGSVEREIASETGKCVCVRGVAGKSSEARMWVDAD